jgi:hypothetical protein
MSAGNVAFVNRVLTSNITTELLVTINLKEGRQTDVSWHLLL